MKFIKTAFSFLIQLIVISLLTVITQIGGIIYLINQPIANRLNRKILKKRNRFFRSLASFSLLYLLVTLFLVPPIAKQFGRVPLPWFASAEVPLKPLNLSFCLLNRHYVRPTLKQELVLAAQKLDQTFKGTELVYLDANFPFLDRFPLLPHRSHHDGRKVDLAFFYKDAEGEMIHGDSPSLIGYGVCEGPKKGEYNTTNACENKGYWQYGALAEIVPQWSKDAYRFDSRRTRFMVKHFASRAKIGKIFIEPHLKTRLGLGAYNKIRFHGCPAVRHDDHLHVQL